MQTGCTLLHSRASWHTGPRGAGMAASGHNERPWTLSRSVSVLYTHQLTKKKKTWKEGRVTLGNGCAVLLDANGRELEEQAVTQSLLRAWAAGEELPFEGFLVTVDEPMEAALQEVTARPPIAQGGGSEAGPGHVPPPPPTRQFKRPRSLHAPPAVASVASPARAARSRLHDPAAAIARARGSDDEDTPLSEACP